MALKLLKEERKMTTETELIFAYGSLMSWTGISGKLREKKVTPPDNMKCRGVVTLKKGQRGFSKPADNGKKLAMNVCGDYGLSAHKGEKINNEGFEGLLLEIRRNDFWWVRKREGYPRCIDSILIEKAWGEKKSIAEILRAILDGCKMDEYPSRLYEQMEESSVPS